MSILTIQKQRCTIINKSRDIFNKNGAVDEQMYLRFKADSPIRNEFDNLRERRKITNSQLQLKLKTSAQFGLSHFFFFF